MAGIRDWLVRLLDGESTVEEPKKQDGPAAVNPYQAGADRIRTTATWLAGAFGAVATVMLAGTQLSTIGSLSFPEDGLRLGLAIVAAIVAVASVAFAIYRLSFVQAPVDIGLEYVRAEARRNNSRLAKMVLADLGLRANYRTLEEFLNEYDKMRVAEYEAETALRNETLVSAPGVDDTRATAQHKVAVAAAERAQLSAHDRVAQLRPQMVTVFQLAGYLAIRSRFDDERRKVLGAAIVAAVAIVSFSWAANPPEETSSATDSVAQNPTLATLTLTQDGEERLKPAVGEACAARALAQGIRVIALSGDDATYQVVLVPEYECSDPVTVTIGKTDGTVRSFKDVE